MERGKGRKDRDGEAGRQVKEGKGIAEGKRQTD